MVWGVFLLRCGCFLGMVSLFVVMAGGWAVCGFGVRGVWGMLVLERGVGVLLTMVGGWAVGFFGAGRVGGGVGCGVVGEFGVGDDSCLLCWLFRNRFDRLYGFQRYGMVWAWAVS